MERLFCAYAWGPVAALMTKPNFQLSSHFLFTDASSPVGSEIIPGLHWPTVFLGAQMEGLGLEMEVGGWQEGVEYYASD